MPKYTLDPTPNPNSMKISGGPRPFIQTGMAAFSSADEAAGHPLGTALFGIEGIANVFIMPAFLTVSRAPEYKWDQLLPKVEQTLDAWFEREE